MINVGIGGMICIGKRDMQGRKHHAREKRKGEKKTGY